jgi:NAD(P)-dependent dehydrogenase (short-subunit alcohol dehydrogenase family)
LRINGASSHPKHTRTHAGIEATLATNHLGQLLLLSELLPLLTAVPQGGARVVLVASDLHKRVQVVGKPPSFPDHLFKLSPALAHLESSRADSDEQLVSPQAPASYHGMQVIACLCFTCRHDVGLCFTCRHDVGPPDGHV